MEDNSLDTLTTIEARVLQQRYGVGDLNEPESSFRAARLCTGSQIRPIKSVTEVAGELEKDAYQVCIAEQQARRKLSKAD